MSLLNIKTTIYHYFLTFMRSINGFVKKTISIVTGNVNATFIVAVLFFNAGNRESHFHCIIVRCGQFQQILLKLF